MTTDVLTPTAQKIDKLIKRIEEGDIKIPAFQRGFVWKQDQVIELLESIVNEYPMGSVLLWNTSERLKSTRNVAGYTIPEREEVYPVNYVLDGQQRLASIYGVFSHCVTQEHDSSRYNPDTDIFEIYWDFDSRRFLPKAEADIRSNSTICLRNLIDPTRLINELATLDPQHHQLAKTLMSQFLNYEIPVVTVSRSEKSDVGIIFERINNTGTRLSVLDLMTAWTWTEDFHLVEASNELMEELEEKGFGGLKYKTLLQIVSGVIQNTTKTKDILNLSGENVREGWNRVTEALRKATDFLATDLNCRHLDFLPFHQQLVGLSTFFDVIDSPDDSQLSSLRKWFWKTSFSKRYSTGQTSAKMDADIKAVRSLRDGDHSAFDDYKYDVTVPMLNSSKFSKANPLTRAFLLLMAQTSPVDLVKNQKIDIGSALSHYNRKEYHHVFPRAFLKERALSPDQIFCVLNFCFLSSDSNKRISGKSPSDYFFNIVPKDKFTDVLSSNLLPIDKSVYKSDNYSQFLEKRASLIIAKIDEVTN
ncbi:MAG: DUF262 domain-containing protein [candidate division Zixibacteria bacterium]|nr:DUF262 domain-containing protein [candidate division Zixibacteria bacterium]